MHVETAHPDQTVIPHTTNSAAMVDYETLLDGNGIIADASPSNDEDGGSSNPSRSASLSSQK